MTPPERAAALAEAARLWHGGRPLAAGKRLWPLVPPADRARWAARVLAWAYAESGLPPGWWGHAAVAAVIAASAGAGDDAGVADAEVDAALRRAETSGRFDSREEAVLALARNAARLLPGAAASDPRAGWWFVASLKRVADEVGPGLIAGAWPLLAPDLADAPA